MSRMDKYNDTYVKERVAKNKNLYDKARDINIDYIDINYDNSVVIDPKRMSRNKREDYQSAKALDGLIEFEKEEIDTPIASSEERVYDINEILKQARETLDEHESARKRLINTEYNILSKLNIDELESRKDLSKADLHNLIDTIYEENEPKEKKINKKSRLNYDDDNPLMKELMDTRLSRTENLLKEEKREDLEDTDTTTTVTLDLAKKEDEIVSEKVPDKEDLEEDDDDEIDLDDDRRDKDIRDTMIKNINETQEMEFLENRSRKLLISIIIVIIIILIIGAYFLFKYFST